MNTSALEVAYADSGPENGLPVVLLHGFPYDIHAYDAAAHDLAQAGCRVIVPFLRGFGPTRFLAPATPRSGEQAALGRDLLDLIDALRLDRPIVVGYDWGGRAACVVSALWPEKVGGLVSVCGYNVFANYDPSVILAPEWEHLLWYQYYLHRDGAHERFGATRTAFCRYLWKIWSPTWNFDEETFLATAPSFENPDFVDVVIHSYRHRFGLVPGDPALTEIDRRAAMRPPIAVPTIVLHGDADSAPLATSLDASRFSGPYLRKIIRGAGHNLPQEAPDAIVEAVLSLVEY
ncbi:MAG: alpha/beta hydrolase [Georgfuchsia sp.]